MKTFRKGGIHPQERKISSGAQIEVLPVPPRVVIPLDQALGSAAVPIVEKGSKVRTGQLIAKGDSFISANLHASVSGIVSGIDEVPDSNGCLRRSITIETEGDEWDPAIDRSPEIRRDTSVAREEIIRRIQECGIVGLGGATFPTHVKLSIPTGKRVEVLLINGAECEPCLTCDHRIMLERGEELLIGTTLLMKAVDAPKAVIGIECNKQDAIDALKALLPAYPGIAICPLKVKYPQGAEKQLIRAVTGRMVPSGKLPAEVNVAVQNVSTAVAVYEAVQKNKPLIERVVTVTGKKIAKPSNLLVRLGTPVSALIDYAGGLPEDTGKLISGGPMMGKSLPDAGSPVVKGMSGIVVMTEKESARPPLSNCIRCARCLKVCPMGLEPYLLAAASDNGNFELMEHSGVLDCIECGCCHYICPSGRPLLDQIRTGKSAVARKVIS